MKNVKTLPDCNVLVHPARQLIGTQISEEETASREDIAFGELDNALLEVFDRQLDDAEMASSERIYAMTQMKLRAAQVTETLKVSL